MTEVANLRKLIGQLKSESPGLFQSVKGGKVELTRDPPVYDQIKKLCGGTGVEGSLLNALNKFGVRVDINRPDIAALWLNVDDIDKGKPATLIDIFYTLTRYYDQFDDSTAQPVAKQNILAVLRIIRIVLNEIATDQLAMVARKREELEARKRGVEKTTAEIRRILSEGNADQEKFDLVVREFNSFRDGFTDYVIKSIQEGRDRREKLETKFKEESDVLAKTVYTQGQIENTKQVILETQKRDLLKQSADMHLLKLNRHVIDLQSAMIGHLRDAFVMTSQKLVDTMSVKSGYTRDSMVWTTDAENLASFMAEKIALLCLRVQKRFIISSEFSNAVADMFKDVNTALLEVTKRIMLSLNTMISKLTVPGIREKPQPIEPCFPFAYERPVGALSCWGRGTERSVLKNEFRRVRDADIQVVCCKKHKNDLERVREIKITGYVMHRLDKDRRVWVMNVKNGF